MKKFIQHINTSENIFITNISEPEENALGFDVVIGKLGKKQPEIINDVDLGPVRPIYYDEYCVRYSILFETYISYNVTNESYENISVGDMLRITQESPFLEYLKQSTIAFQLEDDKIKDFTFISLNHIIQIASVVEPKITKITPNV